MSINFRADTYANMINNFAKTLTRTPATKTTNPITGEEVLTDGTDSSISGALYRKEDAWSQDKVGLFREADVVIMVLPDVTINKNDKITYGSYTYRIHEAEPRLLGDTHFYNVAWGFKI